MKKEELKKLIDTAAGRIPADTVIKNCQIVNVFSGKIQTGDIALSGDKIAGIGEYQGVHEVDAQGRYAVPGFIDSHIHIESPTSARKNWGDFWCLMEQLRSLQTRMKL